MRSGRVFLGDGGRDGLLPKRQADGPVVRQIHLLPGTVVERQLRGGRGVLAGLGEGALERAEFEIARRIAAMAQVEAPTEVEQQTLTRCQRCVA